MDSFFSLFDPSEGNAAKNNKKRHKNEDIAKKNPDAPKGRRRGRRSHKNETLPEESSFLCEPDLSNEILVKDCNYIENYFEVNKPNEDPKTEDKKPRRRNSGRKNRRKKNKISPAKELQNGTWDGSNDPLEPLNNQTNVQKNCDEKIGKNVNDLKLDFKTHKRKTNDAESNFADRIYNVIDKLEKVSIKDNMYLAGDLSAEDLESDFFYSSDDMDDFCDDTTSEASDSGEECYGSLPPEPRFGNVEYKLQLVSPCERRFQHLVTQLKWRLRSGGGSAVYVVGVRDNGALVGLHAGALRASLCSLRDMARALGAVIVSARARRVTSSRAVAEVYIRKLADTQQSVELRVAVMGAIEAGKSTLIGVLTQGELDNGRGSARLNMFRHLHEVRSGRTSSLSHEILGFDSQGNVVNYGCSELMTAERIGERSSKLVSFLDLAGHSKYQRTTVYGLTGYSPHYAMIVISATAGITPITEEHIGLLLALELPFFAVINKTELASSTKELVDRLGEILSTANKKPLLITDENLARNCIAPSILDSIDNEDKENEGSFIPVFPVSCVRGVGLNSLHAYLLALRPPAGGVETTREDETCEFQIDEIFHVASGAPVVGGLLARGALNEGDTLLVGPLDSGQFVKTTVLSIYRNRVPCASVRAGQSASLGLRPGPVLRPGMVLLAIPEDYGTGARPAFGGCGGLRCGGREISELVKSSQEKNRKNARRNKNIKEINITDKHTDKLTDALGDGDCVCSDVVPLEDPNDPRGCIYFQASVHLLRHSTSISPGFQCSVHVGNVRQTAIIEGILSAMSSLRPGQSACVLFRFARCPEYLRKGRRLLFTAGLGTRAIGVVTQTFPYIPQPKDNL
ncbi:GTP-binding protein 2-like [Danaus plexippus]|nr:GTP-binding protein 2-like [Danaus plexippus]